jgi:hypothetical protein
MTLHIASDYEGKNTTNVKFVRCYDIGNIKRHIIAVYEGRKPYKCDICYATFAIKNYIKTHERKKP